MTIRANMEMDVTDVVSRFRTPAESLRGLDAEAFSRAVSLSSDVAFVVDGKGFIRDVSVSDALAAEQALSRAVDRRWIDVVTHDSKGKVEDLLREAGTTEPKRWREINLANEQGATLPLRFVAVEAGSDGRVLAFGRDMRAVSALQQRLLHSQQALERDFVRLRQAESRYRLLFQIAGEAVLIAEPSGPKRIVEANPAAGELLGTAPDALAGQAFARLFHPDSRDAASALLSETPRSPRAEQVRLRLADGRNDVVATSSVFRQDGAAQVLVKLWARDPDGQRPSDGKQKLLRALNRIPDAFVIADESHAIIDANLAFLDLTHEVSSEAVRGQMLDRYLGRPGIDLNVLQATLRDHGWARNFSTILRTAFDTQEEIELSAVRVEEGLETFDAFVIRPVARRAAPPNGVRELQRSPEELKELVGRVPLREIVRETTDVIERMCIEAALALTGNNRASAAEMLGLSRQSLYSKLHRYGLASTDSEPDAAQ